jgi:hypothetical protein
MSPFISGKSNRRESDQQHCPNRRISSPGMLSQGKLGERLW